MRSMRADYGEANHTSYFSAGLEFDMNLRERSCVSTFKGLSTYVEETGVFSILML